jgi:hypothetical protein
VKVLFGPFIRKLSRWAAWRERRSARRALRCPEWVQPGEALRVDPVPGIDHRTAGIRAETSENIALMGANEARSVGPVMQDLAASREYLHTLEKRRREAESDAARARQNRDAYVGSFEGGEADPRLGRGGWRRGTILCLYAGAILLEVVAYRNAMLVLDPAEWEAWLLAGLSIGSIIAAKATGASLKRVCRRLTFSSNRRLGSATWLAVASLGSLMLLIHYSLAYVRQAAMPVDSPAAVIPFPIFMILTGIRLLLLDKPRAGQARRDGRRNDSDAGRGSQSRRP